MDINNPHDAFFKEVFTHKDNIIDLIQGFFPENICKNIDFKSLELDINNYIDEELKEYFSDIVYNCQFGNNPGKIALLFEHKSYLVDYPHFQIIKYMLKIWELSLKNNESIIPVMPIIFYHGKKQWEYKSIFEYFSKLESSLKMFIPNFDYLLIDLSTYSQEQLKERLYQKVCTEISVLLFKNAHDEKLISIYLEDILKIGKLYFNTESGLKFLESVLIYLYNAVEEININEVVKTVKNISEEGGDRAMTIAMQLKKEGETNKTIQIAKKMLKKGYDIKEIIEFTDLTEKELNKIKEELSK